MKIPLARARGYAAAALAPLLIACGDVAPRSAPEPDASGVPVGEAPTAALIQPNELEAGSSYRLPSGAPMVADLDPGDPAMAMTEPTLLPPESVVFVRQRIETAGTVWYEMETRSADARVGWVSLQALVGREIVPER